MKRSLLVTLLIVVAMLLGTEVLAQCPMCRIAAESNLENGGSSGKGLNQGILYMLLMPYVIIFGIGYIWWKNRKTDQQPTIQAELGEALG